MPVEVSALSELINTVGLNAVTLLCCFWYIRYQSDTHTKREQIWMDKDTQSDLRLAESSKQLAELQRESHTQLLGVLSNVNTTLKEMTVAISRLENKLDK